MNFRIIISIQIFSVLTIYLVGTAEARQLHRGGMDKLTQCGGEIDADSDTLNYPGSGESLQPGEVCVWTIHLQTKRDFKFNGSDLNVNSNFNDCRDGGVRIYSINNLVPAGGMESYTLCNQRPSEDIFYLGGTVAVVVLYVGTSNFNPGSGFNISWDGSTTDPLRTQHISSYSSAEQGIIEYPVVGLYEPRMAATWLINTAKPEGSTRSDFALNKIDLEGCSNPVSRCNCDALILYEVSESGVLTERERFCGETTSAFLSNLQSRFVLAFFTDFESLGDGGEGFEATYYPNGATPTTTQSTISTTTVLSTTIETTTEWEDTSTPCGTVLQGEATGRISYKAGQLYDANERCVWTIRIPDALGITFTLVQSGIAGSDPDDGVSISTFTRADPPLLKTEYLQYEGIPVTMSGSVAVVTFVTDNASEGLGIILNYAATGFSSGNISSSSRDFISKSPTGSHDYPSSGNYTNSELSTFVITTPDFSVNNSPKMTVAWIKKDFESSCYDYVVVYKFYPEVPTTGWSQYDLYCATSPKTTSHTDLLLYVFLSDFSIVSSGFTLQWNNEE